MYARCPNSEKEIEKAPPTVVVDVSCNTVHSLASTSTDNNSYAVGAVAAVGKFRKNNNPKKRTAFALRSKNHQSAAEMERLFSVHSVDDKLLAGGGPGAEPNPDGQQPDLDKNAASCRLTNALNNNNANNNSTSSVGQHAKKSQQQQSKKHSSNNNNNNNNNVFDRKTTQSNMKSLVMALKWAQPEKATSGTKAATQAWREKASKSFKSVDSDPAHEICRFEDSPFYAHKVCGWYSQDINAKDSEGKTPLHLAALFNKSDSVKHLLLRGADANAKTSDFEKGAIHLATQAGNEKVIKVFSDFSDKVNMNLQDEVGNTALHLAAKLDSDRCAELLITGGTKICVPCFNGFYPLHTAAKCAAVKVIEVILQEGEKLGYTREQMLGFSDQENNAPLHSAVNSGDVQAVRILLEHGARVDSRQHDNSTAFHLACAQGTLSLVQVMYEAHQKVEGENSVELLFSPDILGMTPLHRAAMFDHANVVSYLIEQGSDVNATDNEKRTPLMLTAMRGGSATMRVLLDAKANVGCVDMQKRNLLHYIVKYSSAKLTQELVSICQTDVGIKLLNERDTYSGCTPLHLASKQGKLRFLDSLLVLGATLNSKDNDSQSPLHFAAGYGRVNTVRRLLESPQGSSVINEIDAKGMTALHIASQNGHDKVASLLINKGALIHRDFEGRTPLHVAAENGHTNAMELLLSVHRNLLDLKTKKGNTPLHSACAANKPAAVTLLLTAECAYVKNTQQYYPLDICIEERHVESASKMMQHKRWREIIGTCSTPFMSPTLGLIQHLPEVEKIVLDNSLTSSGGDPSAKNYWEKYDFRFLQIEANRINEIRKLGFTNVRPLMALNTMVQYGRIDLLSHPVCLMYLGTKWKTYGFPLHCINMFVYLLFITCLTLVIVSFDPRYMRINGKVIRMTAGNTDRDGAMDLIDKTIDDEFGHNITNHWSNLYLKMGTRLAPEYLSAIPMLILMVLLAANVIKELGQIFQQRFAYLFDLINYVEWTLYISTSLFVYPIVLFGRLCDFQWQCGAVAVFLAWFNLLMYLQRLNSVGLYVTMFLQILKTVLRVTFVFSILFISFGLTFYILTASSRSLEIEPLTDPILSIVDSVNMMMGDMHFTQIYGDPYLKHQLLYPVLNFLFLILFVLLIPILFINLLIGLAVGDIEMVQKNAELRRLAMQVEYHTELEDRWVPTWLLNRIDKPEITLQPNSNCITGSPFKSFVNKLHDMGLLPDFHEGGGASTLADTTDPNQQVYDQLDRTRAKLRDIQSRLDRQHDLLRLIVQKMEITSEADDVDDDGGGGDDNNLLNVNIMGNQRRRSRLLRSSLMKK